MPGDTEHYQQLLANYINNTCTPQQVEELQHFLQQDVSGKILLQQLQFEFNKAMEEKEPAPVACSDALRQRLMQAIAPAPVIKWYHRLVVRAAAAAIIIMVLGAGWFFFLHKPAKEITHTSSGKTATSPVAKQTTGAMLTLPNGEQIPLDNTLAGTLIGQSDARVVKLADGVIAYDTTAWHPAAVSYHTLTVPRGHKMIQLQLADGTMVWLNTASSLTYPTVFNGPERNIQLTGEAYFEVKHDAGHAFNVRTNNMTIHVLGTAFNVSAYDDDEQYNVVLVKGSVALTATGRSGHIKKQLAPGNLASYEPAAGTLSVTTVNTEEHISWRKGYLIFKQAPLQQIIKRLSRYYDVHINTDVLAFNNETFSGRLDVQKNIEDIMNLVCIGTSFVYVPEQQKLILKK